MMLRQHLIGRTFAVRYLMTSVSFNEPVQHLFPEANSGGFKEERVKWLLGTAIKLQTMVEESPYKDQGLSFFVRFYKHHLKASQHFQFFDLLSTEFGATNSRQCGLTEEGSCCGTSVWNDHQIAGCALVRLG